MKGQEHDLDYLESQVKTLRGLFDELINPIDWEELIPIWKRPGWTTPAEFRLVVAALDGMVNVTGHLVEMKKGLIEGSNLVELRQ